jgi:hypothetical protein
MVKIYHVKKKRIKKEHKIELCIDKEQKNIKNRMKKNLHFGILVLV